MLIFQFHSVLEPKSFYEEALRIFDAARKGTSLSLPPYVSLVTAVPEEDIIILDKDGNYAFPRKGDLNKGISKLVKDFKACKNECCILCGKYKEDHLGACDGCRWKSYEFPEEP